MPVGWRLFFLIFAVLSGENLTLTMLFYLTLLFCWLYCNYWRRVAWTTCLSMFHYYEWHGSRPFWIIHVSARMNPISRFAEKTGYKISSIILKGLNMNSHRRQPVECDVFKFQPRCCGVEQQSKQKCYPDELAMLFNEAGIEPLDKYVL